MRFHEFIDDRQIFNNGYERNHPLVSIVTPTYCRMAEGFLKRCVESVLNQTFTNFEFIIVDDGSSDGSQQLIVEYASKDNRIVYIRHDTNCGLPAVRTNEGILKARGDFVAFIFDDNIWEADFLKLLLHEMEATPADVQYSITNMKINEQEHFFLGEWPLTIELLYHLNTIPNGSVLCRKSFFERYGLYDPHIGMRRICDWDLWFRAKLLGASFHFVNKVLSTELGPSSPVSVGVSVKMDYKLAYSYMADESLLYERTKTLLPHAIEQFDVFDFHVLLPYLKSYEEYVRAEDIIYAPYFERHTDYQYERAFNNRWFDANGRHQLSPFQNEMGLHRKLRILLVGNTYNDNISEYKHILQQQHPHSIIISCGEWQLSAYAPSDIDFLFLVDCTGLFILDYIKQFKQCHVPVVYLISYGLQNKKNPDVVDYNQLKCVQDVFKIDLYFPKKGLPWNEQQLQTAVQLMDVSNLVINATNCSDSFIAAKVNKIQLADFDSGDYIFLTSQLLPRINYGKCLVFLNSSLIAGSEMYGIQVGKMLHSAGIDVRICVPDQNTCGADEDGESINKYVQELGLGPAVKAPYNARNGDNTHIESLRDWIAAHDVGLIVCSSLIKDIVSVASIMNIHSVFALFQPTGYGMEHMMEVKQAASCMISDSNWAAELYNKAFDLSAVKIPSIVLDHSLKKTESRSSTISIAVGGTLQMRKRQFEAVRACHLLIQQGYNIELNIYGYKLQMLSSYVDKIQAYIEENELSDAIRLHGLVPMEEVIAHNDIILSASVDESIPQTLLICAAAGLLPIACPCGGIEELVIDGITGYLCDGFGTDHIVDTVKRAMDNRDHWSSMSANVNDLINREYSFGVVRSRLLNHLLVKTITQRPSYISGSEKNPVPSPEPLHASRAIDADAISFSRPIARSKTYTFRCNLNQLSEVGIIFGRLKDTANAGSVQFSLWASGRKLRDTQIRIGDISFNHWTYFTFAPVLNCAGTWFTIQLQFHCPDNVFGAFENKHKRSTLYKVFVRLGVYLPIDELLYMDVRE